MAELKYPNETEAYREAREALLAEEIALVARVREVAALRRQLPPGGKLGEDYVFVGANDDNLDQPVKFSGLFGDKDSLLLYSYMFGPDWDKPCPSCTSLIDGFDRAALSVTHDAAFAVVAKASARQINAWARERKWETIALVSAGDSTYLRDYCCETAEGQLWPVMHVFTRRDGEIFHFWGTEMQGNSLDMVWAYWNLMDMTPEGRPDRMTAPQNFRSKYLEKHYL